ncbi:MAG: hypothetical protein ACI9FR_002172 [Cryomorphaceae bacterium]
MATQIKYLVFKGLEKKEQILFRSFLNLAKNELDYQIVILKEDANPSDAPDILIAGENYVFADSEDSLPSLPTIMVGDDINRNTEGYIARPVQWSDFKTAFTALKIERVEETGPAPERVLPSQVEFAITEMDSQKLQAESTSEDKASFSDEGSYDYELDHMSIDYHSFTNSDYIKVVDDVKQFKEGEGLTVGEPVILVTDDESASVNSVLVVETNALDAWEFSVCEASSDISAHIKDADVSNVKAFDRKDVEEAVLRSKAGFEIAPLESYWLEDYEIIADHETVLYIKAEREMVYSTLEPGKWPRALQNKTLSKLPLSANWKPQKSLNAYPMSRLTWVNTLITDTERLCEHLNEDEEYILLRWPHFDLLELDNNLLKLCTMLFVRPESVASLASKSGYGRSTVRGLMNACYKEGILKRPSEIDMEELSHASNDESMFGKIKDVFR